MKLFDYMGYELIELIKNREISVHELMEICVQRIEDTEPILHSFVIQKKYRKIKKY